MTNRFRSRPLSWSQLSSFKYNKDEWYSRYILNITQKENPEMIFGKKLAKSIEDGKPLAPVTLLPKAEHKFEVIFNGINLIGFADGFDPETNRSLCEYKSGVKPWDQKRVNEHGQIDFYLLCNYITNKVRPEEVSVFLEWIPTVRIHGKQSGLGNPLYEIDFASNPPLVHKFSTARTMADVLRFGKFINDTVEQMNEVIHSKSLLSSTA